MIEIIGLVPEEVGKALPSPIQTPLVSCSSPQGSGDRGRRVGAHPAGAHLVGAEEPVAAGAERDPLDAGDEGLEVVAAPPGRGAPRPAATIWWAPAASCRRTCTSMPRCEVLEVELVGDRVGRDRLAVRRRRRRWPCAAVAGQADEGRRRSGSPPCAACGRRRRSRASPSRSGPARTARSRSGSRSRRRCRRTRRRARPAAGPTRPAGRRRRAAPTTRGGMQAQVLADRRAADLRAQQQRRRLERAAGDDDARRAHGDRGRRGRRERLPDRPRRRPRGRPRRGRAAPRVGERSARAVLPARRRARCGRRSACCRTGRRSRCSRPSRASSSSGSALRTIVSKLQPSASAPSFSRCWGRSGRCSASLAPIRSQTASRWRSKSGPSTPSRPCSLAHCSRTQGSRAQAVGPVDRGAAAERRAGDAG